MLSVNSLYREDVKKIADLDYDWKKLSGKTFMISGATGMIGSFLIDVLMKKTDLDCHIIALGRNENKAHARFPVHWTDKRFRFIETNINNKVDIDVEKVDYVIHLASTTHPKAYATDPIGTITTNIVATDHLLDFAVKKKSERFVFASSVEIYGENRGDIDQFTEEYCGYINCNTMRAGYPEGKRAGEALCQAYMKQKNLDVVVPRLARTYGPTMLQSDTKAISQFIKNGVDGSNIVLKSEGTQYYSYTYVADAVSGLLLCLLEGACGEAYNIADAGSDITLKDLAKIIADYTGRKVIFEIPDELERAGYSKATKALMNSSKLQALGWKAQYNIKDGLERTIEILRSLKS